MLFVCAGNPTAQKVATSATAAQRKFYPGMSAVTKQRISDWRRGKRVPQRFETLDPVLPVD
jgi:hypothetical protein